MSAAERDKWDARYRDGAYEGRTHATALLADWVPRLPRGRALDVACGAGRNALYLAAHGFTVTALDISAVALERGRREAAARDLELAWSCTDLDDEPDTALPPGPFELIVWVRYVHRGLMPHLLARLAREGTLVCEQHLATTADVAGPTSAAFRLAPGELARSASELEVRYRYEGLLTDPDGRTVAVAQLVGTKGA
ncbi:MAG TPA: methyltransferase domain-containing protein [Gammaproteobacteria bacterium]|nr:methyltransferase domain-containing protein [Gammaproteobacteria bacterium]